MRRQRFLQVTAATTAFAMSVVATLAWAWTGGVDQLGFGPYAERPHSGPTWIDPTAPEPGVPALPTAPAPTASEAAAPPSAALGGPRPRRPRGGACRTGAKLVPTCGVLWGVAPGAFTDQRGVRALTAFEEKTQRHQDVYHAYHRGLRQLFPTKAEMAIARQPGRERVLFLNWKPVGATWAQIARGDRRTDAYLDRLAAHINRNFPERFFFAVHHEAEDNIREKRGSGYTAVDYAAMFRHVVNRLRAHGVDNAVTVLVHMAYVPHTTQGWFDAMYPGDRVVDWIGFDTYAYSDPGYGHGDFAELLNRRSGTQPGWPGFYNWAVRKHPHKPLMIAEWGVWSSKRNPAHKAAFYREVGRQIARFPNIRAMVHFDTPHDQEGRDSRVDTTPASLEAYRQLGNLPIFQVDVTPAPAM